MNKISSIIITVSLLIGAGILILGNSENKNTENVGENLAVQNVEIKDGVQYVTITASGGYSPRVSVAKAGIPTKLIVETNNTYDCSLALKIKSLNYQKMLSQTGEEIIDIGTPEKDKPLQGTCSMGMYNFLVKFE